ncbi:MAG: DUF2818 family protein [Burkholderiaceae bacterium]|jgi:hypothetical protein
MQTLSSCAIALIFLLLANTPFVWKRFLWVICLKKSKSIGMQLIELLSFYVLSGLIAYAVESWFGQAHEQGWAFYVVTGCLFLVAAYPGFIYRYLWRVPHVNR